MNVRRKVPIFGYPEIRVSGNPHVRPDFRISGYPDFRIPDIRISGFPEIRISGSMHSQWAKGELFYFFTYNADFSGHSHMTSPTHVLKLKCMMPATSHVSFAANAFHPRWLRDRRGLESVQFEKASDSRLMPCMPGDFWRC